MNTSALRHRAPQIAVAAVLATTIVLLHLLGRGALAAPPLDSSAAITSWAQHRDPVTIGFAVLRLASLVVAYHLVVTSLLMAIGRVLRVPGLVRLADAATLPPLRGTVRRLVGLGLSAGLVLTQPLPTAQAHPQAPLSLVTSGIAHDPDGRAVLERVAPDSRGPAVLRVVERIDPDATPKGQAILERIETPTEQATRATLERIQVIGETADGTQEVDVAENQAPPPSPEPGSVATARHLVAPGDHLWSIAFDHLAQFLGRAPTDAQVAQHWKSVIDRNPQLVDPDVLFPGDEINLPPTPPA